MRLDSALASISPSRGWSQYTGEFDESFVRLVFERELVSGYEAAQGLIEEEDRLIDEQLAINSHDLLPNSPYLLPRAMYIKALKLIVEAATIAGPEFPFREPPPKPLDDHPEIVCDRLLKWAVSLRVAARIYREEYSAD